MRIFKPYPFISLSAHLTQRVVRRKLLTIKTFILWRLDRVKNDYVSPSNKGVLTSDSYVEDKPDYKKTYRLSIQTNQTVKADNSHLISNVQKSHIIIRQYFKKTRRLYSMVYMLMSFCLCLLFVLVLFPKDTIIRKVTDDVVNYELYTLLIPPYIFDLFQQ
jgi:cell shape-determining protein MreC